MLNPKAFSKVLVGDVPSHGGRCTESFGGRCTESIHRLLRSYKKGEKNPHTCYAIGMTSLRQLELFSGVIVTDVNPPLRDNRDTMEFPFLSLQKKRTLPIKFQGNGISLEVYAPFQFGIATIWDWDLIIFAQSHINEKLNRGCEVGPRIRFVPYDALQQMGRDTGGTNYRKLVQTIRRLRVTTVITNIRYDDEAGEERPFSWLVDYRIPKRYSSVSITPDNPDGDGTPDPTQPWEIELPPWLFNSIRRRREILAVHPSYFKLTGGIERWLYRLARKAVPDKADAPSFKFRMDTLHKRSGVTSELKEFRRNLRKIEAANSMPEYGLKIVKDGRTEYVTLFRDKDKSKRPVRGRRREIMIEGKPA